MWTTYIPVLGFNRITKMQVVTLPQLHHKASYSTWVRSIASDDTSRPFAFQFFTCLTGKPGVSSFDSPQAQYISQSLARHLSTMCRQYNDYGSAARDSEEGNLNSLDFPEFSGPPLERGMGKRDHYAQGGN